MADVDQESVATTFERHVPEHPLPEEIKNMTRDDTVCKFCGVSYLIHNEIKAIEEKLKATLAEMEHFRGAVNREKRLIEEAAYQEREMDRLRQDLIAKDEVIATVRNDVRVKDDACCRLQKKHTELQEKLGASIQEAESIRLKHNFLLAGVCSFKTDLGHQKVLLQELKSNVTKQGDQMRRECSQLGVMVTRFCSTEINVIKELQDKASQLDKEKSTAYRDISAIQDKLGASIAEVANLKTAVDNADKLRTDIQQLRNRIHELEAENIALSSKLRTADVELKQFKEQLWDKTADIEKMQRQFANQETTSDASIQRLRRDLELKDSELIKAHQELKSVKWKCEEMERVAADLKQKSSTSNWHAAEIEEQLAQVRCDCEALKSEREMIITAHQSQIEQLRESFKARLLESDRWPQKLEEVLHNEKKKHLVELESLGGKLKENFIMELEIEKQKHQGLLESYLSEYKESDKKMKSELNAIQSRHKAEISEVHRQMAEVKARSRESENTLRKEIDGLKKIIKDLEGRLAKVDNSDEIVSSEWRIKTGLIQRELEEVKEVNGKLEQELVKIKEERTFLEETVRQECEERFELMESLNEAREELLRIKRPPGGYSNSANLRTGNSPLTSASSISTDRSHSSSSKANSGCSDQMAFYKKRNTSSVPHPPQKARDEAINTSNVNIGFDKEHAKSSGKVKGGTLGDSRRRISEAIGRT